jgi:hypothetical protein
MVCIQRLMEKKTMGHWEPRSFQDVVVIGGFEPPTSAL